MKKIRNVLKIMIILILLLSVVYSLSFSTFAHSGRTDSNGGHYNRKTGEYHYHGTNDDSIPLWLILLGLQFVAFVVWIIWLSITSKKEEKLRIQRELEEKRRFEEDRKKYYEMYANKDILKLCGCPEGTYIGEDGLPRTDDDGEYGMYTVYVISNSTYKHKYHIRQECCGMHLHSSNIVKHLNKEPCWVCAQKTSIDTSWYKEYLRIKTIKKNYDIP